jgi:hypothetical protein
VLEVAQSAPKGYKPPTRKIIAGDMLDLAYKSELHRGFVEFFMDSDIFGVAFFGDGATIHKCPLVNVFASSFHVPAMIRSIVECIKRLLEGEAKDGSFISSLFLPVLKACDNLKNKTDIVFYGGGSNFQLAGRIMQAGYPRITVVHGLEHVLSLVFEAIAQIPVVAVSFFFSCLFNCHSLA